MPNVSDLREAEVLREETGKCTGETRRGKGPSNHVRIAEITPGRAISQRGPAVTCKDLLTKLRLKEAGGFWSGA